MRTAYKISVGKPEGKRPLGTFILSIHKTYITFKKSLKGKHKKVCLGCKHHSMKAYNSCGSNAPCTPYPSYRWRRVVSLTALKLLHIY
jgi:hypothetical protein